MRHVLLIAAGLALLATACAEKKTEVKPAAAAAAQEVYQEPPPPPAGSPTVLLVDLEGEGIEGAAGYTMYARRGILESQRAFVAIKSELAEMMQNCDTEACQEKVRAQMGANLIVTGAVGKLGSTYVVRLKLLRPSTGEVLTRVLRQGNSNIEGMVVDAAKELAASIPSDSWQPSALRPF